MRTLIRPIRLLGVATVVVTFLLVMSLVWLAIRNRWRRIYVSNRFLSVWCRFALFVLSIKPRYFGLENLPAENGALYVGNHLTYTDVLVISARVPTCFVTSTEIKRSLGLGQICQMAGCLFVDRKNKRNLINEVSELQEGLEHQLNVAVFPEATSTNGEKVLRFRKPLYFAATSAGVKVVPFTINYRTVGGKPVTVKNRDNIFWYGDMDFLPHIWRLTGEGGATVDLTFLPAIQVSPATDTTQLAEQTQEMVESIYSPII